MKKLLIVRRTDVECVEEMLTDYNKGLVSTNIVIWTDLEQPGNDSVTHYLVNGSPDQIDDLKDLLFYREISFKEEI